MDGTQLYPQSPPTPLNMFQRLVLQWDRLHPYNAAQVLKLAGTADPARIAAAWQSTLTTLGLGRIELNGRRFHHQTLNGELQRYPVQLVPSTAPLSTFVTEQLNRPFDDAAEPPFRPFVLQQDGFYYLGVVYHHWVADSVSIRLLLREWFFRLYFPQRARKTPLRHPHGGYWSVLGSHRSNWDLYDGFLSSVRWSSRNRRVARVEHPGHSDFACQFALHEVGTGLIAPLLAFARQHHATLNDLFLAVAAEICQQFVPLRKTPRRTDLALGTIVDLRPYAGQDLSDTFGLFLGFTSTLCRPADLAHFPRLLAAIARQSRMHKASGVALSSPVRMLAGYTVGRFYKPKKIVEFYRKRVPLAGGISNVNLNRTWAAEFHDDSRQPDDARKPLLDYVRVSPTGPMMPLVFTPTTLGDHLHVGVTYRPSLIAPERACEMAKQFTQRLRTLARGASPAAAT
jgi:hypothetical protein